MSDGMTFWDHLDELRTVIIRSLVITVLVAIVAFCLKDELFAIVLAPRTSDFITYRLMGVEPFSIHKAQRPDQPTIRIGNSPTPARECLW